MDEKVKVLCENFISNRDIIKKTFRGESLFTDTIVANALTAYGATADKDKLKTCVKIVKKNAGALSYLKGSVMMPFAANLSLKEDPKAHFDKVIKIYNYAKKKFSRSEYSALLSIMLADLTDEASFASVVDRGKEIYDLIYSKHPFLTSQDRSVFAVLLALSEKSNTELIDDMEKCYELMKIKYSHKSSIQSVSYVLSLTEGSAREKVDHFNELFDSLREAGKKYGVYNELTILAAASLLESNIEKLRDTIIDIDGFLSTQKGYGLLGLDKKTRLMNATMLTADLYDTANKTITEASPSAIAMSAAQSLVMCIIIAAASDENAYAAMGLSSD